jgi:transposase
MAEHPLVMEEEWHVWYAGIDWATEHHDVVVIEETGQQVAALRVPHSAEGLERLKSFLLDLICRTGPTDPPGAAADPERIACIVEINHGLLISALLAAGFPVYPVNPKTVDRRRKPSGAKTDAIDAYLLAKLGRSDLADLHRLQPDSPLLQELKALTRDQDALVQLQTRLLNQLTACLKAYYPVALELFAKLHQPVTLAFLQRYPTLEAARAATGDELTAFFAQQPHYPGPAAAARRLQQRLAGPQLQADPVITRTKARLMLVLVGQLLLLLQQIAAYDKEIQTLFHHHLDAQLFQSLPGAGRRLAPRLLAEWGDDRARYSHAGSIQALAGTAPVAFQSGKYAKAHVRFACVKPLRNALYYFAWQSTLHEPWAAAYYQRKRREGKSHSMALRALANGWVRIIYAMWLGHCPYDASIFLAAQEHHAPRPAA